MKWGIILCLLLLTPLLFYASPVYAENNYVEGESDGDLISSYDSTFDKNESVKRSNDGPTIEKSSPLAFPNEPKGPYPEDGAVGITPPNITLEANISDPDGDLMDYEFKNASNDETIGYGWQAPNGTVTAEWTNISYGHIYQWYVIADDGQNTNRSDTWQFTTYTTDFVNITNRSGKSLKNKTVEVGYGERGYCTAFNRSGGNTVQISQLVGNWTVEGGNAELIGPGDNISSKIDVGTENTTVWFNLTGPGGHTDGLHYNVMAPTVDSINITEEPGGMEIKNRSVQVGKRIWGNCSSYNKTAGYIGLVEGKWTAEGGNSQILQGGSGSNRSLLDVGTKNDTVFFNVTYSGYNDSVRFFVQKPKLDHINMTMSPNGTGLKDQGVNVGEDVQAYCSGYNETVGYTGLINATWEVTGGNAYLTNGTNATENHVYVGSENTTVVLSVSHENLSDSVSLYVKEATVDRVELTKNKGSNELLNRSVLVGHKGGAYCSAYNSSIGYIGLVNADWNVSGGDASLLNGSTGSYNEIDVGTTNTTVNLSASYNNTSDSVYYHVKKATVDTINITDSPGESELMDRTVPVGYEIRGYCSAYNSTVGYLYTVKANWSATGGDSYLVGQTSSNYSSINVGTIDTTVQFTADYSGLSDSVSYTVSAPTVDRIEIVKKEDSNYSILENKTIGIGYDQTGHAAAFNETSGFVGYVSVDWSVDNQEGSTAVTEPTTGENSTIYLGLEPGTAVWRADYSGRVEDSVTFHVKPPEIDYIQIRNESDGDGQILESVTYIEGETDVLYAAGYNLTYGYVRDVNVNWASTEATSGFLEPTSGENTTFFAVNQSSGTIYAIYSEVENHTDFTILPPQMPEIVGDIRDIGLEEDFGLEQRDLSEYASDPQDEPEDMRWEITGINESILVAAWDLPRDPHLLSLISQEDKFGRMKVTYHLIDSDNNTVNQSAWINVSGVNDAPIIREVPDLYVHPDHPYKFDYLPYIRDIDDPISNLTLTSDKPEYTEIDDFVVTYSFPREMLNETVPLTLTLSDQKATDSTAISVTITLDRPPENVNKLPDVTLNESETVKNVFDLDDYITDPDNDSLYMSYGYTHLNITIKDNHSVDISASGEWSGTESVTFRATDPTGAIVEQSINVTVIPVNDPPQIKPLPPLVVHYDEPYTFNLEWYISDRDNDLDELVFNTSTPEHVEVEGTRLILDYPKSPDGGLQADKETYYKESLTVYVSDGIDTDFEVTWVTVTDNIPPEVAKPLPDVTFDEDEYLRNAFDLDNYFKDDDSEQIFYYSGNDNVSVVIHDNNTVDFYAPEDWNGREMIMIGAKDDMGGRKEDTLWVTVRPVNDAPTIHDIPAQRVNNTRSWVFDLGPYIYDVDNSPSTLTISVNSTYVEVVGHKLLFSYPSNITRDEILIEVSDGEISNSTSLQVIINYEEETGTEQGLELLWYIGPPIVIAIIGLAAFLYLRKEEYTVDDVFLIHDSGVLIKHNTRMMKAERDEDILAGMFTAVQNFVKDAFAEEEGDVLKRMEYGDKTVLIQKGNNVILAVFYSGEEPKWALDSMKALVKDIEKRYEGKLEDWRGDTGNLPGVGSMLRALVKGRKYKRGDWKEYEEEYEDVEEEVSSD